MIILNILIIVLQQTTNKQPEILSTILPFILVTLMFGLPTYFIAKAKGKKSFWYILSGVIPPLSILLIVLILVKSSNADKDRISNLEKEVAELKNDKNKIE